MRRTADPVDEDQLVLRAVERPHAGVRLVPDAEVQQRAIDLSAHGGDIVHVPPVHADEVHGAVARYLRTGAKGVGEIGLVPTAGAVANALHAMAALVASLHTPDGRVAVPGFYADVVELTPAERAALAGLPFDDAEYLAQTGVPATFGEAGYATLERMWARPTLEINGMWGGYQGAGSKTVIPHQAHAKITCRLVPDQDPADIVAKVARHLQENVPPGVHLTLHTDGHEARPYRLPDDHPGLGIAAQVLGEQYGQTPVHVRMGGTLPVSELFQRLLGIYTVFFSFSTADEDFHAPNEFFRLQRLADGLQAWARFWELAGESSAKAEVA